MPHQFISGEIARSAQVNANFQYLMEMLGQMSTPGQIQPFGSFVMGPRQTATLSAAQDTGAAADSFFQISWNASWTKPSTSYVFTRKLANLGGTALRIGLRGLELLATKDKSGDLTKQMVPIFRVWVEDAGKFLMIPHDMAISQGNHPPARLEDRRLTVVFLENPIAIYSNRQINMGTTTYNARNFGISAKAQGIIIRAHVTAGSDSGAGMYIYRTDGNNINRGMVAHATITGTGMGMRTGTQGMVPLGQGSNAGEFTIQRTQYFELANVHIMGYLI